VGSVIQFRRWPERVNRVLFIDESGDHGLAYIDPDWPVLAVFGVLLERGSFDSLSQGLLELKSELWPPSGLYDYGKDQPRHTIFHSRDMRRRTGPFKSLTDEQRRYMDSRLVSILGEAEWTGFASIILKRELCERYVYPENPYTLAIEFMAERLCYYLQGPRAGIVFESRGQLEDVALAKVLNRILSAGTDYLHAARAQETIALIGRYVKGDPDDSLFAGLEMADLCAYVAGCWTLDRPVPKKLNTVIFEKLHGYPNAWGKGLKVFPLGTAREGPRPSLADLSIP